MPHIIIEYPAELMPPEACEPLLDAVHQAVAGTGLFEVSHIRVRAIPLTHYRLGGEQKPFIHSQCRIHAGRSAGQQRDLSEAVLAAVKGQGWPVASITVEVVEMVRASYAKWVAE